MTLLFFFVTEFFVVVAGVGVGGGGRGGGWGWGRWEGACC